MTLSMAFAFRIYNMSVVYRTKHLHSCKIQSHIYNGNFLDVQRRRSDF